MNFAKAVNFAMRNGLWHCEISHCEIFALRNWNWQCKFKIGIAKWHLALRNFALRNFRIAKLELALRNLKLALRNRFWHCEMAFGIAKFRIAKFSHCEILGCEIFALRNGFAKFSHCEMGLRTVCENLLLLILHAFRPVFNCISFFPLFLCFSIEFWTC